MRGFLSNPLLRCRLNPSPRFSAHEIFRRHVLNALTTRTCHDHPLPCNSAANDTRVLEDDAASVFAIGDVEYKSVVVTLCERVGAIPRLPAVVLST
jgi:hypothetical protein